MTKVGTIGIETLINCKSLKKLMISSTDFTLVKHIWDKVNNKKIFKEMPRDINKYNAIFVNFHIHI